MKTFDQLQEGVYDPNIFKAFFLAGGPGSGKSFVVRKTTGGLGLKVVNSDTAFEKLLKDADFDLDFRDMSPEKTLERDKIRKRAKEVTSKMQKNFVAGRLGMIIDGTGAEYGKIETQKKLLQQLGYDTYMIFVNTSLDVALERNAKRDRSVPESMVIKLWNQVQSNIGKFNLFFKQGFIIVDNNDAKQDILDLVYKRVKQLLRVPIRNTRAKEWMRMELLKKQQR